MVYIKCTTIGIGEHGNGTVVTRKDDKSFVFTNITDIQCRSVLFPFNCGLKCQFHL